MDSPENLITIKSTKHFVGVELSVILRIKPYKALFTRCAYVNDAYTRIWMGKNSKDIYLYWTSGCVINQSVLFSQNNSYQIAKNKISKIPLITSPIKCIRIIETKFQTVKFLNEKSCAPFKSQQYAIGMRATEKTSICLWNDVCAKKEHGTAQNRTKHRNRLAYRAKHYQSQEYCSNAHVAILLCVSIPSATPSPVPSPFVCINQPSDNSTQTNIFNSFRMSSQFACVCACVCMCIG